MAELDEARELVKKTGEAQGPRAVTDRAERTYNAMVPRMPDGIDYLAGRIALTVKEAAPALGISVRTLQNAIRDGDIPSLMIQGRRLIPVDALKMHLTAIAYTESGALDAWETAITKAAHTRLMRARRDAYNARKELRRVMREARRRMAAIADSPGEARALAAKTVAQLQAARERLSLEEQLSSKAGKDILVDIKALVDEFHLNPEEVLGDGGDVDSE